MRARQLQAQNERLYAWTIIACPTAGWAESVFGEPDIDRLWGALSRLAWPERHPYHHPALGTVAELWDSLGNTCQQWAVIPAGNGRYELVVENSGMVLDDQNCGTANGTRVQLWMWLNNTCQLWSFSS